MLHEFKLLHMYPKLQTILAEHGKIGPHVIGQYESGSKNSGVEMGALKKSVIGVTGTEHRPHFKLVM